MIAATRLMTAREAAQMMGISYPTLKKFILNGKIETVKTPGGHHRITLATLKAYLEQGQLKDRPQDKPSASASSDILEDGGAPAAVESREGSVHISGANQLRGEVISIQIVGLIAEIVLSVGDQQIKARIPSEAVADLQLEVGHVATALIQADDVLIARMD